MREPVAAIVSDLIDVLLVEDDAGDALMIEEALSGQDVRVTLHVVRDGSEAMAFLLRAGDHSRAPRPGLILLDLNLPKMDGREVLAEIKADHSLRSIPVVVLTTSRAEEDVLRSYDLHANAYITKPVDADAFTRAVRRIDQFYTTVAKLPS
jgi:CheY-like chemotaxis protein